jgi:NitT/TauT family transport system substrate-binding protein
MTLLAALLLSAACAAHSTGSGASSSAPARGDQASAATGTDASASPTTVVEPLPQKITIAYGSIAGSFIPGYLAVEAGLFAKYGVDVELTYIASGTTAIQSLIANEVQFVITSGSEPTAAYLGGAPTRIVMSWMRSMPSAFMVRPDITSPEQLRGQVVGITRFGGQPHAAARLALRGWGLDPENDVQYLQFPGTPEILAATLSGQIAGGSYASPTNVRARKEGLRELVDLSRTGIPYVGGLLAGMQPYIDSNPEAVRRVVQAMLEGIKMSLEDDAASQAAMAKYTRTDDVEQLTETIESYRRIVARAPYVMPDGLAVVLDDLALTDPRARTVRPEELVNTSALEQLDREGFLKRLYGE